MKHLLLPALFLLSFSVSGQIINIPDPNFKNVLINKKCVDIDNDLKLDDDVDTNNDGEITLQEAMGINNLNVSLNKIDSLNGIEYFTNLKKLDCTWNNLKKINLQPLSNLEILDCSSNKLDSLHYLSSCTKLIFFNCSKNQFLVLNLEFLNKLEYFNCGDNEIYDLNGTEFCLNLEEYFCYGNQLTSINVKNLSKLKKIECSNNKLNKIIGIEDCVSLDYLYCHSNNLTILDLQNSVNLRDLNCHTNYLKYINLKGLSNLKRVQAINNVLDSIGINNNFKLEELLIENNNLKSIIHNGLPELIRLDCSSNKLISLDLLKSNKLEVLRCPFNFDLIAISTIPSRNYFNFKIEGNKSLKYICCDDFYLENIKNNLKSNNINNCEVNTYCSFTPASEFNVITGKGLIDLNNKGCNISNDIIEFLNVKVTDKYGNTNYIAKKDGSYFIPTITSPVYLTPILENEKYWQIQDDSIIVNFPDSIKTITQNICIIPNGLHHNLKVTIFPLNAARPGFNAKYQILVKNNGNQIESGQVNFLYDNTVMDFVSAELPPDNSTNNQLFWNFTNLRPFESIIYTVTLKCHSPLESPPVNIGDILSFAAEVNGSGTDESPLDNNFAFRQTVVGSFDPNDKTCIEGSTITSDKVGGNLHYMIRFENTGTYPAENVVVKDVIDTTVFDINSLQIINTSHSMWTRILRGNTVEFIFEGIQLPYTDSLNDGYVAYQIRTKPKLMIGDSIKNIAEIYFDYNAPVITNQTITEVVLPTSTINPFDNKFYISPNPASNILTVHSDEPIQSVEILQLDGRVIRTLSSSLKSVDVSGLPAGTYFIKVQSAGQIHTQIFVKM